MDLIWFLSRFLKDSNVPHSDFPEAVEIPSRNAFMTSLASHPIKFPRCTTSVKSSRGITVV